MNTPENILQKKSYKSLFIGLGIILLGVTLCAVSLSISVGATLVNKVTPTPTPIPTPTPLPVPTPTPTPPQAMIKLTSQRWRTVNTKFIAAYLVTIPPGHWYNTGIVELPGGWYHINFESGAGTISYKLGPREWSTSLPLDPGAFYETVITDGRECDRCVVAKNGVSLELTAIDHPVTLRVEVGQN
jgi:hypothetical protein